MWRTQRGVFIGEVRLKLDISPTSGPSLLVARSDAKLKREVDVCRRHCLAGGV